MTDGRTILATIVQSSVVELFRGQSITVAPRPRGHLPTKLDENFVGASIGFSSKPITGTLLLLVSQSLYTLPSSTHPAGVKTVEVTRELSNQLLGRIKNRLLTYRVVLQMGLPLVVASNARNLGRGDSPEFLEYGFQSLRGDVYVSLRGRMDFSAIVYSGALEAANEGDVILF